MQIARHRLANLKWLPKCCIIVVRNVPCLECPICGETTFADEVSERLEKIVNSAKAVLQDISVIDYLKVA